MERQPEFLGSEGGEIDGPVGDGGDAFGSRLDAFDGADGIVKANGDGTVAPGVVEDVAAVGD